MKNLKTYLDNLYFSLACYAVGIGVLYAVLSALGTGFSLGQHIWSTLAVWIILSALTAAYLTHRTLQKRKEATLIFTRRRM